MTDTHPALAEFIHDADRELAAQELAALVQKLQQDGRRQRSVLRALHDVIIDESGRLPTANHQYHFLEEVRDSAIRMIEHFDAITRKDDHTQH